MVDVSADEPAVPVCPVGPAIVSPAARASAALFGGLAVFQVGLAAGLPWGVAAWVGRTRGTCPRGFAWRVRRPPWSGRPSRSSSPRRGSPGPNTKATKATVGAVATVGAAGCSPSSQQSWCSRP